MESREIYWEYTKLNLQAILNFMYEGEVNVNQEDLQYFLAAAEELRIKGLSQVHILLI